MTVEELYQRIGGDFEDVSRRLPSEAFVAKYIVKFADDSSCADLVAAWRAADEQAAFEAAHTAKGVCGNLALTKLAELSSAITEALRPGNDALRAETDVDALVSELEQAHSSALREIRAFAHE